ncbi:MAG: MBL fold metallo-hydrolase [Clostridia bacterium]|nr:MBL fold metallo-hydrolase [Clostridia bacterium]
MKITPLIYGYSQMKESMAFPGGDPQKRFPISFTFYLIQTEGCNILVDTGCTTMPGWEMKDFRGPEAALRAVGLTPKDITHLLVTHAHHDHIEMAGLYPQAEVYLEEKAFEKGKKYLQNNPKITLFHEKITPVPNVEMLCIGGHAAGSCIVKIGNTVIAGDECYTRRNLTEKIPTATTCDPQKSKEFIEEYSKPHYTVFLCHDE